MTHIAITAGGTVEPIDDIRKITNVSTGRLGWACLRAIWQHYSTKNEEFTIHYILTETAYRESLTPNEKEHIQLIEVSDTESVYKAVDMLTKTHKISYFIHSMAISDFTFDYAVSKKELAQQIWKTYCQKELSLEAITEILQNPTAKITGNTKISSKNDIFLALKQTKKVISVIKKNNENCCLIGFKLLKNVSEEVLKENAMLLSEKNGCDYVFANEISTISPENHTGILVHKGEIIARPQGKKQIAEMIVEKVIKK